MEHEGCSWPLCSDPIYHLLSVRQTELCKLLRCEDMRPGVKELHNLRKDKWCQQKTHDQLESTQLLDAGQAAIAKNSLSIPA